MKIAMDILYFVAVTLATMGFMGWGIAHNKIKRADTEEATQVAFTKREWLMISKADLFLKSGITLWIICITLIFLKNHN